MRLSKVLFSVAALTLVSALPSLADKTQEADELINKPWSLFDLPEFSSPLADVNETEPLNNTCPGEPYTLANVYHAGLTAGDQDWVCFSANAGDLLTLGTTAEGTSTTDTHITLYRDDCVTVLILDDDSGPGFFSLISNYVAPYTGNYYLKIRGFSTTTTGLYRFIGTAIRPPDSTCPLDAYKGFKLEVNRPIVDNVLVVAGPLVIPDDGSTILDLVVDLGISHTWVGDLTVTLEHIGPGGIQSVKLLDRPGVPASTFGCGGDLVSTTINKYYFGTGNLAVLGESSCPITIPTNCYAVAPENAGGLLPFRGVPKAGEWWIRVLDSGAGDSGTLINFSIHVLNDAPVSTESASWGAVKSDYR